MTESEREIFIMTIRSNITSSRSPFLNNVSTRFLKTISSR